MNADEAWGLVCTDMFWRGVMTAGTQIRRGDRVRIKEGYDGAGTVLFYEAKSNDSERVIVTDEIGARSHLLPDAIEPHPYTREERIERAIEDYEYAVFDGMDEFSLNTKAILFAILDAGV